MPAVTPPPAVSRQMQRPPSTSMATPVIMLASSEHRKAAALPMSSGVEKRPIGIVDRNLARISGVSCPMKVFRSGVSPATGLMAVDPDAERRKLHGHGARSRDDPAFRGIVPGQVRSRTDAASGGHIEHDAAFSLLEMWHDGLRAIVDGLHVDVGDSVEHVVGHRFERLRRVTDASIVDEDIESAKFPVGFLHDCQETGFVGDIRNCCDSLAAERADHALCRGLIAIGHDDAGSFGDEFADDALAEAGAAACHDRDLVFQSHGDPRSWRVFNIGWPQPKRTCRGRDYWRGYDRSECRENQKGAVGPGARRRRPS